MRFKSTFFVRVANFRALAGSLCHFIVLKIQCCGEAREPNCPCLSSRFHEVAEREEVLSLLASFATCCKRRPLKGASDKAESGAHSYVLACRQPRLPICSARVALGLCRLDPTRLDCYRQVT